LEEKLIVHLPMSTQLADGSGGTQLLPRGIGI